MFVQKSRKLFDVSIRESDPISSKPEEVARDEIKLKYFVVFVKFQLVYSLRIKPMHGYAG